MFTGLVEAVGAVADVDAVPGGRRVRIRTPLARELRPGDSLSVDGVCLTVTEVEGDAVSTDIGPETARLTTLGMLASGARVNLERAARADTRLGGHLVQGHVDATTTVDRVEAEGESHWIGLALPREFAHLLVSKGSVAVNGVSLTVAHLEAARFEVMIIPFTWEHTNLSGVQVGSAVNLECDMVGKYVARAVEGFRNRW
jgi:riboflavin synthase